MFISKDFEIKVQVDSWLEKECYPETEVASFMLKAPDGKRPASSFHSPVNVIHWKSEVRTLSEDDNILSLS